MVQRSSLFLTLAVVVLLIAAIHSSFHTPVDAAPGPVKWDYKVVTMHELIYGSDGVKKVAEAMAKAEKPAEATAKGAKTVKDFYSTLAKFPKSLETNLNKLGNDGWEVASMTKDYMIFKRKR